MKVPYPVTQNIGGPLKMVMEDYSLYGWTVPRGTIIDGASVPSWLHWYADDDDDLMPAATVHDWLYQTKKVSRERADEIFYAILIATGLRPSKAWVCWAAVRMGGWYAWRKQPKRSQTQPKT